MHNLENELLEKGIIDAYLIDFKIGDWYSNVTLSFEGKKENQVIDCIFNQCLEIDFKHDITCSKGKNSNNLNNFKYFIQDIRISELENYFYCEISAWPFNGKITCKNIYIETKAV